MIASHFDRFATITYRIGGWTGPTGVAKVVAEREIPDMDGGKTPQSFM